MSFLEANMRALVAAAAPLTGQRATGAVRMYSATGTVEIPRGTYAYPLVGASGATAVALDARRPVKVLATGRAASWAVGTTGADVPFLSAIGGVRHNFPAGTRFVFQPPVEGLTGPALSPSGFGGGADPTSFGSLFDLAMAEQLSGPALDVDMRRAQLSRFPAAVLTWRELAPADGSSVPTNQRGTRVGANSVLYRSAYTLHVICSRLDDAAWRRQEAMQIVCELLELLTDRVEADHETVSSPGGVQVQDVRPTPVRQEIFQRWIVYSVDLNTSLSLSKREGRTFHDWLLTRLKVDRAVELGTQGGPLRVADVTIDMRPTDLEVGGRQVQAGGERTVVE
jgi:hypothetical protein